MELLPDGIYDVIVVDAHDDEDARANDVVHLDLALTSGARKGEVVQLAAHGLGRDAVSFLGLPATLRVERGEPRLSF